MRRMTGLWGPKTSASLDLLEGFTTSHVDGDGKSTCQVSDIHADLQTHEGDPREETGVRPEPSVKGGRACEPEGMMKEQY